MLKITGIVRGKALSVAENNRDCFFRTFFIIFVSKYTYTMAKAKPFVKWVGGKGQLIEQLEALLPADFDKMENVAYIDRVI